MPACSPGRPPQPGPNPLSPTNAASGRLLPVLHDPARLRHEASESGVTGRGGASFPLARKLFVASGSPGNPIIVVNGSEGASPGSRKDRTLLSLRPHLVLDGAAAAAFSVGATDIIVYVHRHRLRCSRR